MEPDTRQPAPSTMGDHYLALGRPKAVDPMPVSSGPMTRQPAGGEAGTEQITTPGRPHSGMSIDPALDAHPSPGHDPTVDLTVAQARFKGVRPADDPMLATKSRLDLLVGHVSPARWIPERK